MALKAFTSLTREQKAALARTLDGFITCLVPPPGAAVPNPHTKTVISEHAWQNRANWGSEEWNAWETWGWYRHFCRLVRPESFELHYRLIHVLTNESDHALIMYDGALSLSFF